MINKIKEIFNYELSTNEKTALLMFYAGAMFLLGVFLGKLFG